MSGGLGDVKKRRAVEDVARLGADRVGAEPGDILDGEGNAIGTHQGPSLLQNLRRRRDAGCGSHVVL